MNNENVEAVAELCLRTEGLPLAIELAAFQMKYYSPQAILSRLANDRLNFLVRFRTDAAASTDPAIHAGLEF